MIQSDTEQVGMACDHRVTELTALMVLRSILCANPTAEQVVDALRANGLKIGVILANTESALEFPVGNHIEWVRDIAKQHGISVTELARVAGLAPSTLNKKMSGAEDCGFNTTTIEKIAEADRLLNGNIIGHPKAYVQDVLTRYKLTPGGLAAKIKVSASTISRAMNDPNHKFKFSLGTLQKIKEWDQSQ